MKRKLDLEIQIAQLDLLLAQLSAGPSQNETDKEKGPVSSELIRFGSMAEANLDENGYVGPEKRIKHYSNLHRILLVGEGDFSFAACLARKFGSAVNMVATSLDSRGMISMKYASPAIDNLEAIDDFGGTVLHEVDAHTMSKHPILKNKSFDRIVYNFPHVGFHGSEASLLQLELHRDLVRGFLNNAKAMLAEDGEIHVTHKTSHPYSEWGIEKLAEEQGLFLVEEVPFCERDYVGYVNRRGSGVESNRTFPIGEASTYKFRKKNPRNKAFSWSRKCGSVSGIT